MFKKLEDAMADPDSQETVLNSKWPLVIVRSSLSSEDEVKPCQAEVRLAAKVIDGAEVGGLEHTVFGRTYSSKKSKS